MKPVRYHFMYTFRIIRFAFPLTLIPMLRLIIQLDWANFIIALKQNLLLLFLLFLVASFIWYFTKVEWDQDRFLTVQGTLFRRENSFITSKISAIELRRSLRCRVLGATLVTVYFTAYRYPEKLVFYLPRSAALSFRNTLMEVGPTPEAQYSLSGLKRIIFIFLSGDIISTFLFGFLGYRQTRQVLGEDWLGLLPLLEERFFTLEQTISLLFPAGVALILSVLFILAFFTMVRSLFQTAFYSASRYDFYLKIQYGLFEKIDCTVRMNSILFCDIKRTPLARILRHRPVYIASGSYQTKQLPFMICRYGEENIIMGLLPQWHPRDKAPLSNTLPKSIMTYIWLPFSCFAFFLFLLIVAQQSVPSILYLLLVPNILFFASTIAHLEAYFYEGMAKHPKGGISISYTRYFSRHEVLLFTSDFTMRISETPVAIESGRSVVYIHHPGKAKIRIRGVSHFTAHQLPILPLSSVPQY